MAFESPLFLRDDGGFPFILTAPLVYFSKRLGRDITVPSGFPTDFASIPRPLWAVLSPIGSYDKAAVIHDFLYRYNGVSRAEADLILKDAMEESGTGFAVRWVLYLGVRSGGGVPWKKYRSAT